MTIYATPFLLSTLKATAPSFDSGFESLNQVVELMGSEYRLKTAGLVIYGDNDERVLYSKIPFRIDRSGNND